MAFISLVKFTVAGVDKTWKCVCEETPQTTQSQVEPIRPIHKQMVWTNGFDLYKATNTTNFGETQSH